MSRRVAVPLWSVGLVLCSLLPLLAEAPPRAPATDKKPVADDYHGTRVTDDYRWLEDATDPAVRRWMRDQNRHTRAVLDRLPARAAVETRLGHPPRSHPAPYQAVA